MHRFDSSRSRSQLPPGVTGLALLGILACLAIASSASAVTIGLYDFETVTTYGWGSGPNAVNPPVHVATGGPNNNGHLQVNSSGIPTANSRLTTINGTADFTGDYTAAGVTSITLDVRNPNAFSITVRVGLFGGGKYFVDGIVVPAMTTVLGLSFDLGVGDLIPGGIVNDPAAALAAVTSLRIYHNDAADFRGAQVAGSLEIDNIRIVPEPSTLMMLGLAAAGLCAVTRMR